MIELKRIIGWGPTLLLLLLPLMVGVDVVLLVMSIVSHGTLLIVLNTLAGGLLYIFYFRLLVAMAKAIDKVVTERCMEDAFQILGKIKEQLVEQKEGTSSKNKMRSAKSKKSSARSEKLVKNGGKK